MKIKIMLFALMSCLVLVACGTTNNENDSTINETTEKGEASSNLYSEGFGEIQISNRSFHPVGEYQILNNGFVLLHQYNHNDDNTYENLNRDLLIPVTSIDTIIIMDKSKYVK